MGYGVEGVLKVAIDMMKSDVARPWRRQGSAGRLQQAQCQANEVAMSDCNMPPCASSKAWHRMQSVMSTAYASITVSMDLAEKDPTSTVQGNAKLIGTAQLAGAAQTASPTASSQALQARHMMSQQPHLTA